MSELAVRPLITGVAGSGGAASGRLPGLSLQPDTVLAWVLATQLVVPAALTRPKIGWALLLVDLVLVLLALARGADRIRWSATAALLVVPGLLAVAATPRHGSLLDLADTAAGTLLLVGCGLLAGACDRRRCGRLVGAVLAIAGLELAVAAASAVLGTPAPWGYLGDPGSLFGVNPLLPMIGGRATGTMGHPIPFGTLMAVAAVLALSARWRAPWPVRLPVAAVFTGGVLLSGSRSAIAVLVLAAVLGQLWPTASRLGVPGRVLLAGTAAGLLVWVDPARLDVLASAAGTGSVTHRLGALDAAGRLLDRPLGEVLSGSGSGALSALFDQGVLQQDGFHAVDNQLVTTLAVSGLLGVAALLAAVVVGLLRGERTTRPAALVTVAMFASFDVLEWRSTAVLTVVLLALGGTGGRPQPVDGPAAPPAGPERVTP